MYLTTLPSVRDCRNIPLNIKREHKLKLEFEVNDYSFGTYKGINYAPKLFSSFSNRYQKWILQFKLALIQNVHTLVIGFYISYISRLTHGYQ